MKIAVDVDDVLACTTQAYLENYNQRFGTGFSRSDVGAFDLSAILRVPSDFITRDIHDFIYEFGEEIPLVEGTARFLDLIGQKHEMIAITGRQPSLKDSTEEWLEKHFSGLFSKVHFTNLYPLDGRPSLEKADVVSENGARLLIDDHFGNCISCAAKGIDSYLFNAPWNAHRNLPPRVERVFSWQDVYERLAEKS